MKDLLLILIAVAAVLIFINQNFPGSPFDLAGQLLEEPQQEESATSTEEGSAD